MRMLTLEKPCYFSPVYSLIRTLSGTVQILPILLVCLFNGHDRIDANTIFIIIYTEENGELPCDMHTIPDNASGSVELFNISRSRIGLFQPVEMFHDNAEIFFFETFTEFPEL